MKTALLSPLYWFGLVAFPLKANGQTVHYVIVEDLSTAWLCCGTPFATPYGGQLLATTILYKRKNRLVNINLHKSTIIVFTLSIRE